MCTSSSRTILITCWVGERAASTLFTLSLFLNRFDELLDNFEVNVRFQQGHANLTQNLLHILGREPALAPQVLENALQLVGKIVEHDDFWSAGLQFRRQDDPYHYTRFALQPPGALFQFPDNLLNRGASICK